MSSTREALIQSLDDNRLEALTGHPIGEVRSIARREQVRRAYPNFVAREGDNDLSLAIVAEIRLSRLAEGLNPDTGKGSN